MEVEVEVEIEVEVEVSRGGMLSGGRSRDLG